MIQHFLVQPSSLQRKRFQPCFDYLRESIPIRFNGQERQFSIFGRKHSGMANRPVSVGSLEKLQFLSCCELLGQHGFRDPAGHAPERTNGNDPARGMEDLMKRGSHCEDSLSG